MVHPIMDKYYDQNPRHRRSAAYVQTKGLAANEKTAQRGATAAPTPSANLETEVHKRLLGPTIPFGSSARSRTPETSNLARTRTPLSFAETPTTQSDVRNVTEPPVVRPSMHPTASQGNIKKKRASLSAVDAGHGPLSIGAFPPFVDVEQPSPLTPEPHRTEYGNPNKIAQFFPELNLAQ